MRIIKSLLGRLDAWQRRHRVPAITWAVQKKFGEDNANVFVVALGWYGFTAIFPLLLLVVTIMGFIGERSLGSGLVSTLHKFPVVGADFNPANTSRFHGSAVGLAIGLLFLLYGAQGVTQTAQEAMATIWRVPPFERSGFLSRLGRGFAGLVVIGGAFVVNAFGSTYANASGQSFAVRVPVIAALLALNVGFYFAAFRVLTAKPVRSRRLLPGAMAGSVGFTTLITIGTGLVTHQLRNASSTYGTFGGVIGVVAFLLLVSRLSLYAAELNPVMELRQYPRAMPFGEPTDADKRVLEQAAE
jgi:uncharacterized BrkB/YihY/UPF0761 family membrane protein